MTQLNDTFRSRFEFKQELGKGGMGEVYLAYDSYSQRDVAIKLAKLQMMEDPEIGARADRFARRASYSGTLCRSCPASRKIK